jgi:hypothetical protein
MSEPQNLFKSTKHNAVFEMRLIAAAVLYDVVYLINDHRVSREDYLAALQMAEAM